MNCNAALEAMLDAEPSELAGEGATSLATHLAACSQCRAVAQRVTADTRLLAVSFVPLKVRERTRHGAPVWVRRSLVPVGLVAALLLAFASRMPDVPDGSMSSSPAVAADPVTPPQVVAEAATAPVHRPTRKPVRAYPTPIPVAAVRIKEPRQTIAPTMSSDGAAVVVEVPAGERVAVMRTSNPKITVVWLY